VSNSELHDLWRHAITVLVVAGGPAIILAVVVGLVISIVQAATQLNDASLSFVPKIAALLLAIALGGSWFTHQLERHLVETFSHMTNIGRGERT
jgi:flagellar biosynthetic protein FliQ